MYKKQIKVLEEAFAPFIAIKDAACQQRTLDEALLRGDKLEENIAPLVQALWELGIPTASSCEGHAKGGSTSHPFVLIGFWGSPHQEELHPDILKKLILILGLWNGGIEPMTTRTKWILFPRYVIKKNETQDISMFLQPENVNPRHDQETQVMSTHILHFFR